MTDSSTNPPARSGAFDLNSLGSMLTGVADAYRTQTLAEDRIRQIEETETQAVRQSAIAVNQMAQQEAGVQLEVQRQSEQERALATGSPLDMLGLMTLQQLAPSQFTQEGRNQVARESEQRLGMAANIHATNVGVSEARISAERARVAGDLGATERALGMISVQAQAAGVMLQGYAASEQLRNAALSNLPASRITSLLDGPDILAGAESVSEGGFMFTALELRERKQALATREALAMLQPAEINGTIAESQRTQHRLILGTMAYPELLDLAAAGGILPNGQQVDLADLQNQTNIKLEAEQLRTSTMIGRQMAQNQLPDMFVRAKDLIDREAVMARTPGTPLYNAGLNYRTAVGAAQTANSDPAITPQGKLVVMQTLQAAEAEFQAAVQQEAMLNASGDERLAPILRSQLLGETPDPRAMTSYVTEQYRDGLGFDRVFSDPTKSTELRNAIDFRYRELEQEFSASLTGVGLTGTEKKALREQAATEGLQRFQSDNATLVLNTLESAALSIPSNPLAIAKFVPADLDQLESSAQMMAADRVASEFGVERSVVDAVMRKEAASVSVNEETKIQMINAYNSLQVGYQYDLLEQRQPGLGAEYTAWIANNIGGLAQGTNTQLNGDVGVMTRTEVANQVGNFKATWMQADETRTQRGARVIQDFYSGASDPSLMLRATIGSIAGLTDEQKSTLMTQLVDPVLKAAKDENLTPDQATARIMEALDSDTPDLMSPALRVAARKALRMLPAVIAQTNTVIRELQSGAMKSVESRGLMAERLSTMTTGATPTATQRNDARDLVVGSNPFGQGANGPNPRDFIGAPGGPEALIEELRRPPPKGLGESLMDLFK